VTQKKKRSLIGLFSLALVSGLLAMAFPVACGSQAKVSRAYRISHHDQLIGGPRALGEIGDFMLENDQIRLVIQDKGFSRGSGIYGGSLIDADIVRTAEGRGAAGATVGRDNFGEMFAAFFLQALDPVDIRVVSAGGPEEPAKICVDAFGNDFIGIIQQANEVLLGDSRSEPSFQFETCYTLAVGKRYVEITTRVINIDIKAKNFPNAQLFGEEVPTPLGDILLFGDGNKVFMPHEAGFDLRFRVEREYKSGRYALPAFPGLVGDFIASHGDDVSYAIMGAPPEDGVRNFAENSKDFFPEAESHSVHMPFIYSAFTGAFQVLPPPRLEAGDSFSYTRYFIVGDGDVASVSDVAWELLDKKTGTLQGRLVEKQTRQPVHGAKVVVHDGSGRKITVAGTDHDGHFTANLPAGTYGLRTVKKGRAITNFVEVKIDADKKTWVNLDIEPAAKIRVTTVSKTEGVVPAKVTLVGVADLSTKGRDTREWLFDLSLGEPWRYTDFEPDEDDPQTRRFIEDFDYSDASGSLTMTVRPGTYTVVVSRGMEYNTFEVAEVELKPGKITTVIAEIERVIHTPGYIGADFHLHSINSLDSAETMEDRIRSFAGEGLEYAVATDHNFVTDYSPTITAMGFEAFMNSAVGLELTTMNRGHFNAFPLALGDGQLPEEKDDKTGGFKDTTLARTYGSVHWQGVDPGGERPLRVHRR
jgi:hypothetical protein